MIVWLLDLSCVRRSCFGSYLVVALENKVLKWGLNSLEYLRGTLGMRRHFETPCGSYMGGDTLESMQQWRPSNLTVDSTISPEDIRGTGDLCCRLYHVCIFLN